MTLFKWLFGRSAERKAQTEAACASATERIPSSEPPYTVRIAAYDSFTTLPRTVDLVCTDFPDFIEQVSSRVYALCREKGGRMPFMVIREAVENLIHADFADAVITVMPNGNIIRISDHGPGIPDKERVFLPGFTTASGAARRRIKGVGSGLPIVRESLESLGGSIVVEDNLGRGSVITLSITHGPEREQVSKVDGCTGGGGTSVPDGKDDRAVGRAVAGAVHSVPPPNAQGSSRTYGTDFDPGMDPGLRMDSGSDQYPDPLVEIEESVSSDLDNITDKKDSHEDQSNKRQDEQNSVPDEMLDSILSSRQKKVFLLIAEMGEIGPSTVTKELDISLSTAYRDLVSLEELHLVASIEGGKRKLTQRGVDFLGHIFK